MADAALSKAMLAYKTKHTAVKAQQKQELEDTLKPWLSDIGREINRLRAGGYTVREVGDMLGVQNRSFIYSAIAAAKDSEPAQVVESVVETDDEQDQLYTIEYFDGVARVTFGDDESYELVVVDGDPDVPEEWGEHSRERRMLYRDILKEVTRHYADS